MINNLILVVEDDKAIRNLITTTLEINDYNYKCATNGQEGLIHATTHQPSVIILDLGLPDMDGKELIKKIRRWSNVPIIVVSARGDDEQKIESLDLGADDYITKPFSVDELLARLRVSLRRSLITKSNISENRIFTNDSLKIDYESCEVFLDDNVLHLTPNEYKIVCLLSQNLNKVLSHNFILKEIWTNPTSDDIATLRVFVATLRKKLDNNIKKNKFIQTHIGVGYRMISYK